MAKKKKEGKMSTRKLKEQEYEDEELELEADDELPPVDDEEEVEMDDAVAADEVEIEVDIDVDDAKQQLVSFMKANPSVEEIDAYAEEMNIPPEQVHEVALSLLSDFFGTGPGVELTPEDVDPEALARGIDSEMKRVGSEVMAEKIALDNLAEDPMYYEDMIDEPAEDDVYDEDPLLDEPAPVDDAAVDVVDELPDEEPKLRNESKSIGKHLSPRGSKTYNQSSLTIRRDWEASRMLDLYEATKQDRWLVKLERRVARLLSISEDKARSHVKKLVS